MAKTKGYALITFKDAGTEQNFEGGQVHDFEPGQFANFEAAGLVRAPTSEDVKGRSPESGAPAPAGKSAS